MRVRPVPALVVGGSVWLVLVLSACSSTGTQKPASVKILNSNSFGGQLSRGGPVIVGEAQDVAVGPVRATWITLYVTSVDKLGVHYDVTVGDCRTAGTRPLGEESAIVPSFSAPGLETGHSPLLTFADLPFAAQDSSEWVSLTRPADHQSFGSLVGSVMHSGMRAVSARESPCART